MAPTDGAIVTKMNMCTPQTTDVNISKGQSSRAIGLGGVQLQRSKSATILYKYRSGFFLCVFEKLKGRTLKLFSKLKAKNSRSFPKLKVSEVFIPIFQS